MSRTNVFDGQKLHIMEKKCSTCIFRPGNLMSLEEGRVEQMVEDCIKDQGVIPCHKTTHGDRKQQAVCRGFFDVHKRDVSLLQVAERIGILQEDPSE